MEVTRTWVAFVAALLLALPQPFRPVLVITGAALGLILIVVGSSAASRCRPPHPRTSSDRTIEIIWSLLLGALLGAVLLGALWWLARLEPALHARFAHRQDEPLWRPLALAFESSILEEITFRLFALSVLAWIVSRLTSRDASVFRIAWLGSTLLFGLAHIPAWSAATRGGPLLFALVLLLNGAGGLLLGWLFWRWGLVQAICCHFAGDLVVQALGPRVL